MRYSEPHVTPDCIEFWNREDEYVTIDFYNDGTIGLETTGPNYRDRDNYDTRDGVDVRFNREDSVDFINALHAWIEQLPKGVPSEEVVDQEG